MLRRLLTPEGLARATESGVLHGQPGAGLYAFEGGAEVGLLRRIIGGVGPSKTEFVTITGEAAGAFQAPLPTGILNLLRRGAGVRVATGSVLQESGAWSGFAPYASGRLAALTQTSELGITAVDSLVVTPLGVTAVYYSAKWGYYEAVTPR